MNAAEESAFRAFVHAQGGALTGLAYVLTGSRDDAQDLLQSALTTVVSRWRTVRDAEDPAAYVKRLLVNKFLDDRRRARRRPLSLGDGTQDRAAPHNAHAGVDDRDQVQRLLMALPPRERAVLALRFLADQSEAATAQALGISVGSVKAYTSRGLARVRSTLPTPDRGDPR